jgi:hypothetical protein
VAQSLDVAGKHKLVAVSRAQRSSIAGGIPGAIGQMEIQKAVRSPMDWRRVD